MLSPLSDRLLVETVVDDEKTSGGIIIPETAKDKPNRGKVVAVGPGRVTDSGAKIAPAVSTGDLVLFSKYAGSEVEFDGSKYLLMREEDILGIISA